MTAHRASRPRYAGWIALAALLAIGGLGWGRYLRGEEELLQTQNAQMHGELDQLAQLPTQQRENQRLAVRQAEADELAALRAEQGELDLLRADVATCRRQLTEQAARTPSRSVEDSARASVWRVGEALPVADWTPAGQATPDATLRTYLAAVARHNPNLMQSCLCVGTNYAAVSTDHAAKVVEYLRARCRPDLGSSMDLVSLSQADEQNATATTELVSVPRELLNGVKLDKPGRLRVVDFSPITITDTPPSQANGDSVWPLRFLLRRVDGDWKIVLRADPPEVTLINAGSPVLLDALKPFPQDVVDHYLKGLARRPGPLYLIWSADDY